ncbi:MAG: hypothetical protein V8T62_04790 [Oscillospiraceae bacterium]
MERIAGAGLEKDLEKLTSNRLKGVALGAIVTAAIQSSAATAIMAVVASTRLSSWCRRFL